MKKLITVLLGLIITSFAMAEVIPVAGSLDSRIRTVNYNPDQVFHINAKVGVTTHFKFSEGEVLEKWFSGDADAFLLLNHKNYVSFKPVVQTSSTNLLVLTNKRSYNFSVHVNKKHVYYGVHFLYPEDAKKRERELALAEDLKKALDPKIQSVRNVDYSGAGSRYIRPTKVFDNGTHTFFYFPERIDIPSIFRVRYDDNEFLTQATTIGNWRVVPRVQERWTLRLGEEVICVRNNSYTTDAPDNDNNTVMPSSVRVNKGVPSDG